MIKVICVGGGKAKSVPEVRPPKPERVPVFNDLVELTRLVVAYQDYVQAVERMGDFKSRNWRSLVNNARVMASRIHRELNKGYTRWRKMG